MALAVEKADGMRATGRGMRFARRFTGPGDDGFAGITWVPKESRISEPDGRVVFEMKGIEVPSTWSQLATDIAASKYFRKAGLKTPDGRETSARQLVVRVARTIRRHGEAHGYFASADDAAVFEAELTHLLITQKGAFNSPVWFNCGLWHEYGIESEGENWAWDHKTQQIAPLSNVYERPQCSACFIQRVEDSLSSIFDLVKNEAMLFKYGSGTGTNFSRIRGKGEKLSGGGTSSGLMSFLKVLDAGAGSIKSGGTTRRAAKMACLDLDHPEVLDFIEWKSREERKVKALIDAGYPSDFNGEAYQTVSGQNSNNSVRITDEFMQAVQKDGVWHTRNRSDGAIASTIRARELMQRICESAWACADPGVQFDTIINDWHTCPNTDRIWASNPCSEYMFLDDSACNLASLNLMKFIDEKDRFDVDGYRHATRVFTAAMEILVGLASYPTKGIAQNSHDYRPLGLGFANLGTLLMVQGIPYDSDEGRAWAGALTAVLCGEAYRTSAELAGVVGPFPGYARNQQPFLRVMSKHRDHAYKIPEGKAPADIVAAARKAWDDAVLLGQQNGYRNAQATVIAPTGTIGLLMDCDTTGVEPEFSIVKWKKLAGGGHIKIVNNSIPRSLRRLGYSERQVTEIVAHVLGHGALKGAPYVSPEKLKAMGLSDEQIAKAEEHVARSKSLDDWTPHVAPRALKKLGLAEEEIQEAQLYVNGAQTVEGAPHLRPEHYAVFDCANKCGIGKRFLAPMAHIRMMGAIQPFISGAISKTVNLPNETTVADIERTYVEAWRLGLKAVAVYRDGSKFSQPLSAGTAKKEEEGTATVKIVGGAAPPAEAKPVPVELLRGYRKELPARRDGFTVETAIMGHKVFLRTGQYEDGRLGEIFIDMYKEGAAYRSLMNCFAIAVSIGLQYGVPLEKYVNSFTFTRFAPAGMTDHPNVKTCTSVVDFIFRVLGMEYLGRTDFVHVKPPTLDEPKVEADAEGAHAVDEPKVIKTAPPRELPLSEYHSETDLGDGATAMNKDLAEFMGDAPLCDTCGHVTVRNGACYKCINCGSSIGCS